MSIKVKYIYSACIVTETRDLKILHDPWFSEGIYDGSWYHFPKIDDPLKSIGDVDLIYVSHIHPDHYDPEFLKHYFDAFGKKRIIIADHKPNYLAGKMRGDGFEAEILDTAITIGKTSIEIMPHITGSASDIDSAIIIKHDDDNRIHSVVNANDIIFDEASRLALKKIAGNVDILLCGYTGAGPYPQTYFDTDDSELRLEADRKKNSFFERYKTLCNVIDAKVNIPFAGKYLLGGKLSNLNRYRGVADPVEVLGFDTRAVVLADDGGEISTDLLSPTGIRTESYSETDIEDRIKEISDEKMDYERLFSENEVHQLPLKRVLITAIKNAVRKSAVEDDYFFWIPISKTEAALINANPNSDKSLAFCDISEGIPMPHSRIEIDVRYLFGLLTNVYHWNNAEVGSQYFVRRHPNILNRQAQSFLNFLTI